MKIKQYSIGFLLALAMLVSAAGHAATFTSSLPLSPAEQDVPFGETVTVTLPGGLLDLPELPDNEYYGEVFREYHWSVEGGPSGDGLTATVPSSASGGAGVISSPGNYAVVFSGKATYTIRWMEGDVEHSEGPYEVDLTASEGGRLSLPFRLVKAASVSCEGVISETDTPGTGETLVIPVGYNNGSVTLTAMPTPSGSWPSGNPTWSCATASAQDPATATLSTDTPGTYTVTASCGNTVCLTVQVIGISGLTARRKGSGESFDVSATIAAGGKTSDVHKAEIQIQLWPVPLKQATLTYPASLSGAAAHLGTVVNAVLTCGASTLTGNSSGTVTLGAVDLVTGTANAELKSSNVTRTCTATIGGSSINVGMDMVAVGNREYDWPEYFIYGVSHEVDFFPTLQEAADHDADGDGVQGEGAIDGHGIHFYIKSITIRYWQYDWENYEYVDCGEEEIDITISDDPLLRYGLRLSDIMDFGDTSETRPGQYTDTEAVYGFYDYDDSTFTETCVEVPTYLFAVYDDDVYIE